MFVSMQHWAAAEIAFHLPLRRAKQRQTLAWDPASCQEQCMTAVRAPPATCTAYSSTQTSRHASQWRKLNARRTRVKARAACRLRVCGGGTGEQGARGAYLGRSGQAALLPVLQGAHGAHLLLPLIRSWSLNFLTGCVVLRTLKSFLIIYHSTSHPEGFCSLGNASALTSSS